MRSVFLHKSCCYNNILSLLTQGIFLSYCSVNAGLWLLILLSLLHML